MHLPEWGDEDGQGEIRTLDTVAGMPVFETGAFSHSATCPTFGPRKLAVLTPSLYSAAVASAVTTAL
jgi:hypothetical protein